MHIYNIQLIFDHYLICLKMKYLIHLEFTYIVDSSNLLCPLNLRLYYVQIDEY
jgi:hypothetical protein